MPNLNRVMLMGNLTRDPELRYLPNNTAVASFGLAVNRRWRNQQGEMQEEVTFVDCEAWAKQAETINQYLRKGRPIFIEGRLKLDQWEKDGVKHSRMRVVVENFQFIDSRQGGGEGGGSEGGEGGAPVRAPRSYGAPRAGAPAQGGGSAPGSAPGGGPASAPGAGGEPHQPVGEEDIPF